MFHGDKVKEVEKDFEDMNKSIPFLDKYETWSQNILALMKGGSWKSNDLFQGLTSLKKEVEALAMGVSMESFACFRHLQTNHQSH